MSELINYCIDLLPVSAISSKLSSYRKPPANLQRNCLQCTSLCGSSTNQYKDTTNTYDGLQSAKNHLKDNLNIVKTVWFYEITYAGLWNQEMYFTKIDSNKTTMT
jgi:hypothetical protein